MSFTNPDKNIAQLELAESSVVAVFGSGSGGHSFAAARALRGTGKVYAIDVRKDLLTKLKSDAMKQNLINVFPILGDIEAPRGTTLEDTSVDMVIIPNTLFAYDDKPAILKEAFRITKPKGRLLIVEWRSSFSGMGPALKDIVSEQRATELAEAIGFHTVHQIIAGDHHYGIIFRKP